MEAVQDDSFVVIYHNCGGSVIQQTKSILSTGSAAYHFGNAAAMLARFPADTVVMGNIDPAARFRNGTLDSIRQAVKETMEACRAYPNFVISSGCDIPPLTPWESIDAFFAAVHEFYNR